MKTNFQNHTISELAEIFCGGTPSTSNKEFFCEGDIPWITPKDLSCYTQRYISHGSRSITEAGRKDANLHILPIGTVLLSTRAPIGYVALAGKELCINQGFKAFVCKSDKIINDYLYFYFKKHKADLEAKSNGTTFKEVSLNTLKSFPVNIPNIEEQRIIIEKLNCIEEKIAINCKIMLELEQIAYRLYHDYMNSEPSSFQPIGNAIEMVSGGTPSTNISDYWNPGMIDWYSPTDITKSEDIFLMRSGKRISEKGFKCSAAKKIPPYSILLTSRATVGKVAITTSEATTNQGIISLIPNEDIKYYDLYFWVKENHQKILSLSNGSTFKEIFKRDLKMIDISIIDIRNPNIDYELEQCFMQIEILTKENVYLREMLQKLILSEIL